MPGRLIRSLASRMTLAVLGFGLALSLLSAVGLFALQYREAVAAVEQNLESIGRVDVPSISAGLWVMDLQHLQIQLEGLRRIPYVTEVKIEVKDQVVAVAGTAGPNRLIGRSFPLWHTVGSRTMNLGTLHVQASLAGMSTELFSRSFERLLLQTGQIFLVAVFMLLLLRSIVTRRLSALERHLGRLDAGRLDVPLVVRWPRFFKDEDELDHVARTINAMGANLKEAFGEIETQKERLKVTLRSIGDGVIATDTQGVVTMMNEVAENLTGWAQEAAVGRPLAEVFTIVDEATREPRENPVARVLQAGGSVELANHTALVRRDGSEIIVADSAAPIREGAGAIIGVVLVFRDVTERKRMEEALVTSERQLRLIADSIPAFITYVDARTLRYRFANRAFAGAFGMRPEQVVGKQVKDVLGAKAYDRAWPFIERVLAGERVAYENLVPVQGGAHWFAVEYEPELDERGAVGNIIVLAHDIDERKRAEAQIRLLNAGLEHRVLERTAELEVSNKELEAFCYSVSHDLRAPLRAIEGFAGVVIEDYGGCLDAEGQRLLGVVRANAMKMSQLVDDLLAFSRIGRSEMKHDRLEMGAMARAAFGEIVADPAAQARIDFTVGDLPAAEGDVALMRQVWLNLLANAVKFSGGQQRPAIEVTGTLAGSDVVYHVRDNGVGFDMRYADKLFGVFQRLHAANEFEGTGIGLALVQRIVARHGGRVWAQGAVGRGATFSFTLPVCGAPNLVPDGGQL